MLVRLCLAFDIFTFFDAQHIQFIKNNIVRISAGVHLISNTNKKIREKKWKLNIRKSWLKNLQIILKYKYKISEIICFHQNWIILVGSNLEWV